mgnify:CR=1 FL=1
MELDVKQQVLVAIYTEYQKDIPMIHKTVTPNSLGIEKEKFDIAIVKLENEGYINSSKIVTGKGRTEGNQWGIVMVMLDSTKMTPYGIDYVEKVLEIDNTDSAKNKVSRVVDKCGSWGLEQLKDFGVRVLSEVINHQLDKMI